MGHAHNHELTRFRATWASGESYAPGDVVARGRKSYQCARNHIAGAQSEPMHGEDWTSFWDVYPDDASLRSGSAPASSIALISAPPPAAIAAPDPRPADVNRLSSNHTPPVMDGGQMLPAVQAHFPVGDPPCASEIIDDSEEGALSGAWSLDAIRQELRALAQRMKFVGVAGSPDAADPLVAELWRRKCALLGARDVAECQAMMFAAMFEWFRLLRKLQRGERWTAEEVARNGSLESLDLRMAELDERYRLMADDPPLDLEHDRHWQKRTKR
jgi:hypothetical protein